MKNFEIDYLYKKTDKIYTYLYNTIINSDDQEINYDYLVGFPDSDEVFDDIIDTLEEWNYYPKANIRELDEKICHLVLDHIYDTISKSSTLCRDSILWGLYEHLSEEIDNLRLLIRRFRFNLTEGFGYGADLLYLLLSFELELFVDLPLGTLTEYDVDGVYNAYIEGMI